MKVHGRGANVARHRQGGQRCPICPIIVDCGGEKNTTGVYAWLELHDMKHRINDPQLGKTKTSLGGRLRELHRLLEQGNQAQRRAVEDAKPRVLAAELKRLQQE
ncbi:hypothetical protein EXIGLDRAFT_720422 [Exidia glandulosa HHB12029]|uniref:Uncharacterized protein n=1 Tax=Exidia glandulosa HHB12029 TaxID=1314781 RepID=A0A165NIQ0_EXIGL|nr:hypothetical protein EXIGLDRAFT_720422 [Exidia glandulosa HHB12029]